MHSKIQPWHHGKRRLRRQGLCRLKIDYDAIAQMTPASCAQVWGQKFSVHLITEWLPRSSHRLYFKMGDEPRGAVQVVRIYRDDPQTPEVTIFYRPDHGFQVHNGHLFDVQEMTHQGRRLRRLPIVTWKGNKIYVDRYNHTGEINCYPGTYQAESQIVTF